MSRAVRAIASMVLTECLRRKDFYVAFLLGGAVLVYASRLEFYDVSSASGYLMELGLSLVFFLSVVLTVPLAARQAPSEIRDRTIVVLLARPVSRAEFLAGKFLGSWLGGLFCFTCFYAAFLALAWPKAGGFSVLLLIETYVYFALGLGVAAAMASGLSYHLSVSANVTVSLIVYLLMALYGGSLRQSALGAPAVTRWAAETMYHLLPHFEFFDLRQRLVHSLEPPPPAIAGILGAYACAQSAAWLAVGWLGLRRKSL